MNRDFVPHVITANTIDGAVYYTNGADYGTHLGHARAMTKDDADRRAAAWKRDEYDRSSARYRADPHEDDFSGDYNIRVVATTWEALDKAAAQVKTWDEADCLAEEAHDDLYDDYDPNEGLSPEEIAANDAAENAYWRAEQAKIQPYAPGDAVTITDERHPDHGGAGVVVEAEFTGYLVLDLGERLTWAWATGVTAA